MGFVHLHTHSHYTLLRSPITVPRLLTAVKAKGMAACALTDRGNLFGAMEFQEKSKDASVKAILGCQVQVAPLGLRERTRDTSQLVLLAQNSSGYRNLARLVSKGWLDGFYFEPRVDLDLIAQHADGLICLTGAGPSGFLNRHLGVGANEEAARQAGLLRDIFADRLWLEVTPHQHPGADVQAGIARLSTNSNIPMAATAWVHYLEQSDSRIHDVLLAAQDATTLDDPRRMRMDGPEYWLRSEAEMRAALPDFGAAIDATVDIAAACSPGVITTGQYFLPRFDCPDGLDEGAYLRLLTKQGAERRYGPELSTAVQERLAFELDTIVGMGFPGYFLIVQDFIGWARQHDIPVGPGRGSAAGSIVAYALGITDMCPLRYGLLFERFLNPGRKSMPDIDIDFCKDGRERVIRYVSDKYGQDAVTQIMTLGTMKARMAIKDVGRAYGWTPEEAQGLANLVPEDPSGKHDLSVCLGLKPLDKEKNVYGTVEAMVQRKEGDPRASDVLDAALRLENLGRSLGTHACGIIIAPGPVSDYVPVCVVKEKPATQFNMSLVEKCGLLKMDFLGLKTMSVLKKAADLVRDNGGPTIDYGRVPLDDPATFALLATGETLGVFQCESSGFQELIRLMRPDRFEDMIALVALYRPGPLMANMHIDYCDRKAGRAAVSYPHPVLEAVLKETYGLYIYQEQVMSISRELCGFTPADADDLRKAMGKKDEKILGKLAEKFVEGAFARHNFDRAKGQEMFEKIKGFASYCFNKSHSACYGLIAYWTAYMKANHFAAFMTANLVYEMGNKEKMTQFVEELRSHKIPVLPPDVNSSRWDFALATRDNTTTVRFGFGGVKGIGELAAEQLIKHRGEGFTSLYDLCERVDQRLLNRRVLEALIKVGACDSLHPNRAALCAAIDSAVERASRMGKGRDQGQTSLFQVFEADDGFRAVTQGYPDMVDWPVQQRLADEKALTGYWISSHPVTEAGSVLTTLATCSARDLSSQPDGWRQSLVAVITGKRSIRTRTGKNMAVLQCEDPGGRFEAVLFPGGKRPGDAGAFERFDGAATIDTVVLITGTVERRNRGARPPPPSLDDDAGLMDGDGETGGDSPAPAPAQESAPSLIVTDLVPAAQVYERLAQEIRVAVELPGCDSEALLRDLDAILADHRGGKCRVTIQVFDGEGGNLHLSLGENHRIHPTAQALSALRSWAKGRIMVATGNGSRS